MMKQELLIRKITAAVMLIVVFTVVNVWGQQNMPAQLSPSETETAKTADAFLAQWDKSDLPGCAVGAVRDGKTVYKRAFGMANLDYDVPNSTASTRFNLASVSKPFTAASIAILAQQGKLSLDDDVRKYVPELPKYDYPITIRHLVHHTSGIREYQALVFFGGRGTDNAYSPDDILKMLARQKNLSFKPGEKYQYSNSGYFLMSLIVERVSGKSLRAFAEENIFKPLGMKNTQYFDNRFEVVKNRAQGYRVNQDKSINVRSSLFDLVGSGGVLTTVEDLILWTQNYYEPKVGGKQLIEVLTTQGVLNNGEKIEYAFGFWRRDYRGLPANLHSGNMFGYRAQIFAFPEQKFTAIALCNNAAIFPNNIVRKLADVYLDGQLKPESPAQKAAETVPTATPLSEKDAQRYAGFFTSKESGAAFRLFFKEGKLISSGLFPNDVPLTPIAENRFLMTAGNNRIELVPTVNQSGAVSEIKLSRNGGKPDVFLPAKPPLENLDEYTGTYYNDELDADHKLIFKDKNLVLQIGGNFENPLRAAAADYFTIQGGVVNLSFTRDAKGKINGFVFNSGADERDVKGIVFQRKLN